MWYKVDQSTLFLKTQIRDTIFRTFENQHLVKVPREPKIVKVKKSTKQKLLKDINTKKSPNTYSKIPTVCARTNSPKISIVVVEHSPVPHGQASQTADNRAEKVNKKWITSLSAQRHVH